MRKLLICLILVIISFGCSSLPLTDPKLTWTAPTTNCDGSIVSGAISYNVYATQAASFTMVATANESPCGVVNLIDTTVHTKLNTTPITTPTFDAVVADGVWLFTVEAINVSGNRSEPATPVSKTVKGRLAKITVFDAK